MVSTPVVVGNLTSDPRRGEGESKVVNFRMAVNRWRKPGQEQGEEVKERTDYVDVECWGSQGDNILSSLTRGDRAIVAGQIRYDQWSDEAGNPRSRVKIKASAVGASLEFAGVSKQ